MKMVNIKLYGGPKDGECLKIDVSWGFHDIIYFSNHPPVRMIGNLPSWDLPRRHKYLICKDDDGHFFAKHVGVLND